MTDVLDLLYGTRPLVINPDLAAKIGLNEALVLQQVKYWQERAQYEFEGKFWFYKKIEEWQGEFKFWSASTIKRTLSALDKAGLIETRRDLHGKLFGQHSNRTTWYSLKRQEVKLTPSQEKGDTQEVKLSSSTRGQIEPLYQEVNLTPSSDQRLLTEITTETTSPISPKGDEEIVITYLNESKEKLASELGQPKPRGARAIKTNIRKISARIKDGFTVTDCKLVIDYLHERWGHDKSLVEYFVLGSVFVPSKFEDKVIKAQAWADSGRPTYRHGAWSSNSSVDSSVETERGQRALQGLLDSARTLEDMS
ncbi:conserved hypothetical protein [Vibrio chagasii]|uniref:conserved phage C-terminal domain-containing protein n=1 Tax=Vibrio TaxID=662 RepID=UPI000C85BC6A|nr:MULTISPECIES: conserved phage C-terminal domain-containing protein [Vibrio]CAH6841281.1 conserved hypothetical protein [Vibrio chagasii]PME16817.1 hypothetical protein BCV44_13525 [Vibrio cyclitrophicus]TKF71111.1 hypothetical protein FCV55_08610 [Vibrio sp. F13]CAH6874047.1 conserved hypothetical protein [Vibrio chagasii]CAH7173923.1 conserved hypothetical protein [Vibrio chagasii]